MENIQVNFKVTGSELSAYMDNIKRKSTEISDTAISGAIEQNKQAKEQLKLIDEQIRAIERKTRMEAQANRSISLDRMNTKLGEVRDKFEAAREVIYSDRTLSEKEKKEKIIANQGTQQEAELGIKTQYRENLNSIKEQERQAKLQTQFAKENIDVLKDTASKNVKAIVSGDLKLVDVINNAQTADEKLVAQLTKEGVEQENKKSRSEENEKSGSGGNRGSFFNDILRAEMFNKAFDVGTKLMQSKTGGYDMIAPTLSSVTNLVATVLQGVPFLEGVGKLIGKAGDAGAEFISRQTNTRQDYLKEHYAYSAATGGNASLTTDMSMSGVSAVDFLKARTSYAKRRGYATGSNETARDAIYAERGFGVDQGTSAALVEMQRSSRENNRELATLIGGVLEKGQGNIFKNGDNTFLNEFLGKFAVMQKELLKNQTTVATGTTMDIMNRFNKVGGEFDLRDPRSMGNINAINNALSNPSSDNIKAVAYRVLSRSKPNMGIFDLDEEMSKGLGSSNYLKEMIGFIDRMGGGDQIKMKNMQGLFKGLSPAAVRTLFNNREALMSGELSMEELTTKFPGQFKERSEQLTIERDKGTAEYETKILGGAVEAIEKLGELTKDAILNAFSGAVININGQSGTIEFNRPVIQSNKTISGKR